MTKRIANEFAIGIVLVIAIVLSLIIWLENEKLAAVSQYDLNTQDNDLAVANKVNNQLSNKQAACTPHYFDGEAVVHGWLISDKSDGNTLVVQINSEDVSKLPATAQNKDNFQVKLVDADDEIKSKLQNSNQQKPADITVHGYGEACQQPPLISLKEASIAFKKS